MKKFFILFVGITVLALFSSCSNMQQTSSISFSFPDNTAEQLRACRSVFSDVSEAEASLSEENYFVDFSFTGDWVYEQKTTYSNLEELNNASFQFDDLEPKSSITIKVELGCNDVVFYSAENTVELVSGDNRVKLSLAKVLEIPEFTISAAYSKAEDTVYSDGSILPLLDDDLIFTSTSSYSGNVTWTINGTAFEGKLNPASSDLIDKASDNVIVCTVSDENFNKFNRAVQFTFRFENLPESLTLAFAGASDSENGLIYGQKYTLSIAEAADLPSDTEYTWTLNGTQIKLEDLILDTRICDAANGVTDYELCVTASHSQWTATGSLKFKLFMGKMGIEIGIAVPDFTISCSESGTTFNLEDKDIVFSIKAVSDSNVFNIGTVYTWMLNGYVINTENSSEQKINMISNPYVQIGNNTLQLVAGYNGMLKSAVYSFAVEDSSASETMIIR